MSMVSAEQYRIEQVQILNWGGYTGLQVMQAGRVSTAILGPSGRGKSTLLDAMAAVIMPNPQEFNQAARDDKGRKRERTVYTYARGLTVSHQDDNGRSATPSYLRPPGGAGFISGAAITWSTGMGKRVTAFRLVWVGADATDNASIGNSTVYGLVHDAFDLARLDGLRPARLGAAPLSEASMRHLIDPARGDLVDQSQPRMHAAMRRALQMGRTEESQRLAMHLLRRAQASKGIFSINDLFKEFVLTDPERILSSSIAEIRNGSGASVGSIVGFCRTLGLKGFANFKIALARELAQGGLPGTPESNGDRSSMSLFERVFHFHAQSLTETLKINRQETLQQASRLLEKAHRIEFFSIGSSYPVAYTARCKFLLIGLPFRNKPWYRRRVVVPLSILIAAIGLFWFLQRVRG